MEMNFDSGELLQHGGKKHMGKPKQFEGVASGVEKRLETDIEKRRKLRFSTFDESRNIPSAESPRPVNKVQSHNAGRQYRQTKMQKWKEQKKKKEAAVLQKKKPFVVGIPHYTLQFPPQPLSEAKPNTSSRSQKSRNSYTVLNSVQKMQNEMKQYKNDLHSIAPKNKKFFPILTSTESLMTSNTEKEKDLISSEIHEMVEHFRRQMHFELTRMIEMRDTWMKIMDQFQLPEAIKDTILAAVGQANLLMSQKFEQFASLLVKCQNPQPGQFPVSIRDLHGFWDLLYIQVDNIANRFKKIEELRVRGWDVEEELEVYNKITVPKPTVQKSGPAATFRLRDIIAAAKKNKKQGLEEPFFKDQKIFDGGFFYIHSPVKSLTPTTPWVKRGLLKAVLSREAKKALASKTVASHAMLRAALIEKKEVFNDLTPLTPINLTARSCKTPVPERNQGDDIQELIKDKQKFEKEESNDHNIDTGLSSKNTEEKENKSTRKFKLLRQNAFDGSTIVTRSNRKVTKK